MVRCSRPRPLRGVDGLPFTPGCPNVQTRKLDPSAWDWGLDLALGTLDFKLISMGGCKRGDALTELCLSLLSLCVSQVPCKVAAPQLLQHALGISQLPGELAGGQGLSSWVCPRDLPQQNWRTARRVRLGVPDSGRRRTTGRYFLGFILDF